MKQAFSLSKSDIESFPIWFTPAHSIRQSNQDETSVIPFINGVFRIDGSESKVIVSGCCGIEYGYSPLVRTQFLDKQGRNYLGFICWDKSAAVSILQPRVFVNGDVFPFFQADKPSLEEINKIKSLLGPSPFPIIGKTEEFEGLPGISVEIRGLYCLSTIETPQNTFEEILVEI